MNDADDGVMRMAEGGERGRPGRERAAGRGGRKEESAGGERADERWRRAGG